MVDWSEKKLADCVAIAILDKTNYFNNGSF